MTEGDRLEFNMEDYGPVQRLVIQMMLDTGAQEEEERVTQLLAEMWAAAFDKDDFAVMKAIETIQEKLGYA